MTIALHFVIGVFLSFIASIPVGPVNLAVVQNSIRYGKLSGLKIAFGSALVEFFYCFIGLWGIQKIIADPKWMLTLQIISVPILIIMGIFNLKRKSIDEVPKSPDIPIQPKGDFFLGAALTFFNPMLLPFWVAVSAYLKTLRLGSVQLLQASTDAWGFVLGVGTGAFSLLATVTFISARHQSLKPSAKLIIYKILGVLFLVLAAVQIYSIVSHFLF